MKKIFFAFCLLNCVFAVAQTCEPCDERTRVNFQKIEWLGIQKPEDSVLLNEWDKLEDLWHLITQRFELSFQKGSCLYIQQSFRVQQSAGVVKNNKYTLYGIILQYSNDYILKLFMHPACSDQVIAETEIHFQMYPFFDIDKIATQAANNLVPKMKNISDFENKERETKNYGFGGDLSDGYIGITMDKTMVKGEETRVVMKVVDCDGFTLKNKEISTIGTVGGTFTPARFTTDDEGTAIVKFRMATDKTAFVKASCETKNVWGCDDLYTGTEAVKGFGGAPIKVSINYEQYDTTTRKRATLPGVKIEGGDEVEMTEMDHRTVLYYFPSKKDLEDGLLVNSQKEGYYIGLTNDAPDPGAKTIFVTEYGWFDYSKSVQRAKISTMVGNVEMVTGEEDGEDTRYKGDADLQHPSEVMFHLGDRNHPPSFMWIVQYPASEGNIAAGGAAIVKGEDGVQWKVNKITDPKSIYKTEYLLSLTINAAEELRKGNMAMKGLFGVDLDKFSGVIDPTNPQSNMVVAGGYQTINVRILSPYEESKFPTKK